ncbi:hypothetical protein MMC14_010187 [Varicellaria rhodocarpa]|nr:hypothetical protein [Varicellaria rhodocarpa]
MEPISFAAGIVSLAGLFSVCVQCFDMVQLGRARNRDFEILHTKLDNQKVRFMIWGQALGLDDSSRTLTILDRPQIRSSIARTIHCIIGMFEESREIANKYGLRQDSGGQPMAALTGNNASALKVTFRRFQARTGLSKSPPNSGSTVRWVIIDRERFLALVQDLRELIDDLESITRSSEVLARQRVIVSYEIASVSDVTSLELVEAAATDPQDMLSNAASSRREIFSLKQPTLGTMCSEGGFAFDSFHMAPTSITQVLSLPIEPTDLALQDLSLNPQNQQLIKPLSQNIMAQPGESSSRALHSYELH